MARGFIRQVETLTLSSQLAEVERSLLRVVLLDGVAGRDGGSLLDGRSGILDLVAELKKEGTQRRDNISGGPGRAYEEPIGANLRLHLPCR